MALPQPVPNRPLAAARELLRNPPGVAALPDAQRQWPQIGTGLPRLSGGIWVQAAPSSGRRIWLCALSIGEECTDRGPAGGA
jgi:hypothetical protein